MYYLRTKPAANAIQFTVDKKKLKQRAGASPSSAASPSAPSQTTPKVKKEEKVEENMAAMVCSLANKDDCLMCGS